MLRNRVDPAGAIHAAPARGTLMGNRGCLHDDDGRIVRQSSRDAWISCVPAIPGVRRSLMQPGCYTELFFLDEATAISAGHRPCGSCRPEALQMFKAAWASTYRCRRPPLAPEIDMALRRSPPAWPVVEIDPVDGSMVRQGDNFLLRWQGAWWTWSFNGYAQLSGDIDEQAVMITSTAMLGVLRHGYLPQVHPSATRNGVARRVVP